jgi:5-oxoprolinase (ATP-hydrolysing)
MSSGNPHAIWQVCVDTGGTFTDCIATAPTGEVRRVKVLSSSRVRASIIESRAREIIIAGVPDSLLPTYAGFTVTTHGLDARIIHSTAHADHLAFTLDRDLHITAPALCDLHTNEPAPVLAARLATGTPVGHPFPPLELRLATTRGTNALLERRGGPAALFLTAGFRDLLTIGTQQRPDLFALDARKPDGVPCDIIEIPGRLDALGRELISVDLMHAWRNPDHERKVAATLLQSGFTHVSISSEVAGGIGILPRAESTLVNAYLAPVVEQFVTDVENAISPSPRAATANPAPRARSSLLLMTSAAGLVTASAFRAKDSLLSGPAGGVLGAAAAARASGFPRALAFDMGGTSTDVARIDHDVEYVTEHRVGVGSIRAPAVAVESVASGGGSICWFDPVSNLLRVGPQSAGAAPGPACYGVGGPLTITDVNLLLNRFDPRRVVLPLDIAASAAAADALLHQLTAAGRPLSLPDLLATLLTIANEQMAAAIRTVSVQRGYDPADYAMVAFGGAGGQHACAVADLLNVRTIIIPQDVGLLSARGLMSASIERLASRQLLQPLDSVDLARTLTEVTDEALALLRAENLEGTPARRVINARLKGQEASIAIDVALNAPATNHDLHNHTRAEFTRLFTQLYGYPPAPRPLEVESIRVIARATTQADRNPDRQGGHGLASRPSLPPPSDPQLQAHPQLLDRSTLTTRATIHGPALIAEPHATTVVDQGWHAHLDHTGALILTKQTSATTTAPAPSHTAERELLTARLTGIATDMGETLRRTALSTNVKDRLDFSCAVLDPDGELVVNAPHIPVHLGALGLCVKLVKAAIPLNPGDVVVTNHPAFGGSHLPDVTVIAPVFDGESLIAFVAARAHHAEIGGTRPGSMPPGARTLIEEGVVIPPMYLVRAGESRLDDFRTALLTAPFPTRSVEENLADIQAQLAACNRGQHAVLALAREFGPALPRVMHALRSHSETRVRAALAKAVATPLHARELMDDGSPIEVSIRPGDTAASATIIDFAGSADTHPFNLNAPLGVIRSAVMYVLRLLVNEPLPLNEGLLRAIDLRVPPGFLNPDFPQDPAACPAVSGGNVETSQRVVDTLLKALGLAACSQGTMNNTVFGNARFGYYETVCGGAGAGPTFHGQSAVHTHMTNTRITDPELLEHRYPVRLDRFELRHASGGRGHFKGGDGITREITFLEPVSLSILTQHRTTPPYGLSGGEPGAAGNQTLHWPDGRVEQLPSAAALEVPPGARLVLQTPGGGGWGPPTNAR